MKNFAALVTAQGWVTPAVFGGVFACLGFLIAWWWACRHDAEYSAFHPLCLGAGATAGLCAMVVWVLKFSGMAAVIYTAFWVSAVMKDESWQGRVFSAAYDGVASQRDGQGRTLEVFSRSPLPEAGGMSVPVRWDSSLALTVDLYAECVLEHFVSRHPFIATLTDPQKSQLASVIGPKAGLTLSVEGNGGFPLSTAVWLGAGTILRQVEQRSGRITALMVSTGLAAGLFIYGLFLTALRWNAFRRLRVSPVAG